LACQSVSPFFGLSSEYRTAQLKEFHFLMKNLGIAYETLRTMPVAYRHWFIDQEISDRKMMMPKDQYGLDDDTPIAAVR